MTNAPHAHRRHLALLIASLWWAGAAASAPAAATPADEPGAAAVPSTATEIPAPAAAPTAVDSLPPLDALPSLDSSETAAPSAALVGPGASAGPSQNVTINLINRLVQRGVLTKQDSVELIQQAEQDAAVARAQAAAAQDPPVTDESVRVTYIPEIIRARIRDEIKDEVLAQARSENWLGAPANPQWVSRFKPFGDFRLRYEFLNYPDGNDNTGAFPNFNAINTGAPFDVSGTLFSPQYNVDQGRQRMRLRFRLGADVDLGDNFTSGFRFATGENNSPTTTNQSQGLANQGQGGNFSKYAIWLDRAFLKYEIGGEPNKNLAFTFGRFDNPFFATELIWDEDVGFDGVAVQARHEICEGSCVVGFLNAGIFPVFNTDLNFSSNQPAKFESSDKWLYGAQVGVDWKIKKDVNAKFGAAIYDFQNVEGVLSDPFTPLVPQDAGNTDNTRPSFAQKGNTYMALRNIVPSALNNFGTSNQFQYFGLATPFRELAFTGKIDFNHYEPCQISLVGEYVKNLKFDRNAINSKAVNNRGPNLPDGVDGTAGGVGAYDGSDTAWLVALKLGKTVFEKRGDWTAGIGYRYIGSDAVIDGFNDSEFGGGGTNAKGFVVSGAFALSPRVRFGLSWFSSDQIAGPPLKNDTLQIDLSAKF